MDELIEHDLKVKYSNTNQEYSTVFSYMNYEWFLLYSISFLYFFRRILSVPGKDEWEHHHSLFLDCKVFFVLFLHFFLTGLVV